MTLTMEDQLVVNETNQGHAALGEGHYAALVKRLQNDEVITIRSKAEWNGLYDYMERHDIDPDDFRSHQGDIWMA